MRIAPTATELTILRCAKQWTHLYVAVHKPQTLFSARLSAAPTSFPAGTLAFSSGTPTSGTVPAHATIYIGSSAGARDKGVLRLRAALTKAASGSMSVAELGEKALDLATNDYLTIVEDYRPAAKFPRYDSGIWYMDYDTAYVDQNDNYGPLARLGPAAVGFLVGGACRLKYVGERSAAYSPSDSIATYGWVFHDASTSALQGTTASPIVKSFASAVPGGKYHSLAVTETTAAKTHTGRRLTFVFERTGANAPYSAVIVGTIQGGPRQGGYSADLRVINTTADQTSFPDGAHVVLFEEAHYADDAGEWFATDSVSGSLVVGHTFTGGTSGATGSIVTVGTGYIKVAVTAGEINPGEVITTSGGANTYLYTPTLGGNYPYRSNVVMEGWIVGETVRKDYETGSIDFSVTTLDGVLRTIEGYPVALTNLSTNPDETWEHAKRLTGNLATLHFAKWRSTIADIADVEFQAYAAPNEAIIKYVTLDKASLFDQIGGFWNGTLLGWAACDLQGALYCEMDAVLDETVRSNLASLFTIAPATDLRDELDIQRRIIDANSQTVLYAVAYRKPLGSKSPDDPHFYAGATVEITQGVAGPLISGDVNQPDQDTLNEWAGNLRAKSNNPYADIIHRMFGNWRIDAVPQSYFTETISSGDTIRGISLTAVKMLPRALTLRYNERSYSLLADVTADRETSGLGGVAITFPPPEDPPELPIDPPAEDPPINPGIGADAREVWLSGKRSSGDVLGLYWSSDFFSGGQPTWNKVAVVPAVHTLRAACVALDGSAVYVIGSDGATGTSDSKIWQCVNPKAVTPVWTVIADNTTPVTGAYNFYTSFGTSITGNGWFGCHGTTLYCYALGWNGSSAYNYHVYGEYAAGAWTWTAINVPFLSRAAYRAWTRTVGGGAYTAYTIPPLAVAYNGAGVASFYDIHRFHNGNTRQVLIKSTAATTYRIRDVVSASESLSGSLALASLAFKSLSGSTRGNRLFLIDGATPKLYVSDADADFDARGSVLGGVVFDAKLNGGGSLVNVLGTDLTNFGLVNSGNEFVRISRDGTGNDGTWEAMTGNFWSTIEPSVASVAFTYPPGLVF